MKMRIILQIIFVLTSVSLVSTDDKNTTNQVLASDRSTTFDVIDPYYSTQWTIGQNNESLVKRHWVDMHKRSHIYDVSEPSTTATIIRLAYKTNVFGHEVTEVELMREGGIRSADPNLQWDAIPLKIKTFYELMPCQIIYRFEGVTLVIQWNFGFRYCRNGVALSFQLKISPSGKMVFIYKKVPYGSLQDAQFPGIANNFGVSYKYNVPGSHNTFDLGLQLKINETDITNDTVILVKPLPLCAYFQANSSSCLTESHSSRLKTCVWCPAIGICSNKSDFLEKIWNQNNCEPNTNSGRGKEGSFHNYIMVCTIITIISVLLIFVCYKTVFHLKKKWFPLSQLRNVVIWNSNSADDVQILRLEQDEHGEYNLSWSLRQNLLLELPGSSVQCSVHVREPTTPPPTPSFTPRSTPPPPYTERDLAAHQHVDAQFVSIVNTLQY